MTNFNNIIKEYCIQIPIIQRDYAQGRGDDEINEIRNNFLETILSNLLQEKTLHLDFVYGSIKPQTDKTVFVPLDGQQRLTTLFLLHWYLGKKENKDIKISIHFPLKTNLVEDIGFLRDANFNYVSNIIREVSYLKPLYFNTHLGNVFYGKYTSNYKKYIQKANEFIQRLLVEFPNINIYTENVYSFLNQASSDLCAVGTKPIEFIDLFEIANNKSLGFCFDLGHALIQDEDFSNVIKNYNSMLHFNLNDKTSDQHLGLSKTGKYTKNFFYELIDKYGFSYIVLELDYSNSKLIRYISSPSVTFISVLWHFGQANSFFCKVELALHLLQKISTF